MPNCEHSFHGQKAFKAFKFILLNELKPIQCGFMNLYIGVLVNTKNTSAINAPESVKK
jgi:hypothetical protein